MIVTDDARVANGDPLVRYRPGPRRFAFATLGTQREVFVDFSRVTMVSGTVIRPAHDVPGTPASSSRVGSHTPRSRRYRHVRHDRGPSVGIHGDPRALLRSDVDGAPRVTTVIATGVRCPRPRDTRRTW
ncbi:hypothetical protein CFN78_21125 [Amycolatopsis antarctica]|uniref:Uncharacterized protein n=1 Tax=Amycolatopsis antarctica TaxID=1854586 RepID=A0A263D0Y3_9PSEU|nr:hypothetical protein CFN78_21125 [Amycolatopsis antarctica]